MNVDVVADTNVVSYLFREDPIAQGYLPHLDGRIVAISFQTQAELDLWPLVSQWGERRRAQLEAFVAAFVSIPYDRALSRRWAEVTMSGRRNGQPIGTADAWIAATALEIGVPLITHNPSDFTGVDGLALITEIG